MEERVQPHDPRPDLAQLVAPVQARDPGHVAAQQLGGEVPERADDLRLDQLELPEQVVLAGVDLLRQRVAIARRPAFQDVRHEHVAAGEADLGEQRVEQPARLADEREALLVLVGARAPRRRTSGRRRRCRSRRRRSWRVLASCGQRWQVRACSQTAFSSSRRSEALDISPKLSPRDGGSGVLPRILRDTMGLSRYLDARTGPEEPPHLACLHRRRRWASRHGAGRGALGRPGAPARRADPGRPPRSCCSRVPDGKIAEVARAVPAGPLLGHCSGATGLEVFDGREGFSLHPLMSVPTGSDAERAARRGRGGRRDRPSARWASPNALAARARACSRRASSRRGSRRLPRRGRDRGQLPRRARGLRRAPGGDDRDHPRAARPARAGHRASSGRGSARRRR